VLGPLLGGWLTENLSWHYAFFINVPVCIALITCCWWPAAREAASSSCWRGRLDRHRRPGLGLGGLTVVLEEGEREQWFSSSGHHLAGRIVSAARVHAAAIGQGTAKHPVIQLRLLRDRQFGSAWR
jgi:DHA2 family multidrug resistance protein